VKSTITKYDLELVEISRKFLAAAEANPDSRAMLEKYGFSKDEQERGAHLVREAERAFEWVRAGKAYDFLSATPEKRVAEARGWYADTRRRYMRDCLKRAEEDAGWVGNGARKRWPLWRKLTQGTLVALANAKDAASPRAWIRHRLDLRRDLARAKGPRPADAPPPKDTALVELAGWYERWRLLAHRVFRQRPDLLAPYGLKPGKAPPRLRGKEAAKYGEKAAGTLDGAPARFDEDEDEEEAPKPAAPSRQRLPIAT
jgi:hypothetical protein